MNVMYYTYPWAMDIPGGGERQMLSYSYHLSRYGVHAQRFDMWHPRFDDSPIFHCFSVMPGVAELCNYAKKNKKKKLVVSPNLWVTEETKSDYPFAYIWNIFEIADAIVVNSNMEADQLSRIFGMDRQKFFTIYNGVESDFLIPESGEIFKKLYGFDEPYVLNIANVEPRKNQIPFLKAMKEALPGHKLVTIGSIRDQYYFDKCVEFGGSSFVHLGPYPYASEVIRSAIAGCEFFAMPSLLETPSIAALEAAASGAKILITSAGSTTEYFDQTVSYINPWDHDSMVNGIHKAVQLSPANSTWQVRYHFMWTKVMPSLVDFYRNLLA
jgi:glycosyltransferase involved in cell wall biosynthesis